MCAMQKEDRMEKLLANEEKEKYKRKTRNLLKTIKKEKVKKSCLIKALKSREKEVKSKRSC